MFVIRRFSDGCYLRIKFTNDWYSLIYFKDCYSAFDYIRFETPCNLDDFSSYGVVLCPCSSSFENSLSECDFHFGLSHFFVNSGRFSLDHISERQ